MPHGNAFLSGYCHMAPAFAAQSGSTKMLVVIVPTNFQLGGSGAGQLQACSEKWCKWILFPKWDSCFTSPFLFILLPKPKMPPHQLWQFSASPHPRCRDDSTQETLRLLLSCFLPGHVVAWQGFVWPNSFWGYCKLCTSFAGL